MDNDLNKDQSVTDPDLNSADAVNQQDLTDQSVTDQNQDVLADGTSKDKTVKYSEFEKANKRAKEAEEAQMTAQRQLELYQAQVQGQLQAQQTQQVQQGPKTNTERAMAELGLTVDDLYGENQVKLMNRKEQLDAVTAQNQNAAFANLQFIATHPDTSQIVGSVNPTTGNIMTKSPELAAILAKKPYLVNACVSVQATYEIVMQERKLADFEKNKAVDEEVRTRQGVDNATAPLGGSAAGGGGSGEVTQGQRLLTREQSRDLEAKYKQDGLI